MDAVLVLLIVIDKSVLTSQLHLKCQYNTEMKKNQFDQNNVGLKTRLMWSEPIILEKKG